MTIRPGDFWLASVPYTDGSGAKIRPVLVLWLDGQDDIVATVTSAVPRTATDILLSNWQAIGLKLPSTLRLSRLACLHQALLHTQKGHIANTDARRVKDIWAKYIKPQF